MSDTHDREDNMIKAIEIMNKKGCEKMIHCGDFCSPFMIVSMNEFNGEVYCVFGNTDDRFCSTKLAIENNINLLGDFGEIEIDGKKIAIIHDNGIAAGLAGSGKYDVVFYGHSHIHKIENINDCLLVNPGELIGRKRKIGFIIYDTEDDKIEEINL